MKKDLRWNIILVIYLLGEILIFIPDWNKNGVVCNKMNEQKILNTLKKVEGYLYEVNKKEGRVSENVKIVGTIRSFDNLQEYLDTSSVDRNNFSWEV